MPSLTSLNEDGEEDGMGGEEENDRVSSVGERNLPKRPTKSTSAQRRRQGRGGVGGVDSTENSFDWEGAETRPLISSERIEQGKDYWLDEGERKDFEERERAIKNRKEMEGEISKDKLKEEIAAPYKGNWIGLFSLFIGTLTVIAIKFPELLEIPTIAIPDL
ncbi:hypothetical protein TrCOL_g336 [Triparma columacea]|uniref:Uncharacterized protein n=1 Tax=Triparma columacea TaxID=722753 RepID=A0A9W7GE43_9STRA|nr:hypothetical protein TrCOL_g336 [Triparma columacea]